MNPLAVKGNPGESFSFTLALDSDRLASPTASLRRPQFAIVSGVYTRLAALEMLLYPAAATTGGLLGTVTAEASARCSAQPRPTRSAACRRTR